MNKLARMPTAARWWMIAFCIAVVFSAVARRFFPDAMPWSNDLPDRTQAGLRLFTGIIVGMAIQVAWWTARRLIRHT